MSRSRRPHLALVAAVVLALVLASCSVSSSKTTSGSPNSALTSGGGGVDYAAKFASDPVRGVTKTTIKIGIAAIDYKAVKEKYGVDLAHGGDPLPAAAVDALVKAVNDSGGINGRKLQVVTANFIPVGTDSSEQSCRKLVEDDQVFAVLGSYLADNALCVTETYKTPYFSAWGLNAEHQQRSNAPYIVANDTDEQNAIDAMKIGIKNGVFKNKKVAVYWESDTPDSIANDDVIGTLKKAGVDVVSSAKLPQTTDQVKAGQDIDTILQRFKAEGADEVLFLSGMAVVIPALQRTTWHPQVVFTNGQANGTLSGYGLKDPKALDGAIAIISSTPSDVMAKDPAFLACLKKVNANSNLGLKPSDINDPQTLAGSKGATFLPQFCQTFELMVQVLKAAGPNPSSSSMIKGMAKLGDFPLAAIPHASLSPTKWDTGIVYHLWHWNEAKGQFIEDGDTGGGS